MRGYSRPIEVKRYFKNVSRSCTIGVDPDEKTGGASGWDLNKAPVVFGSENIFMPPGSIWFDDKNMYSLMAGDHSAHVFVKCADKAELHALKIAHNNIETYDIPKDAPADHPDVVRLAKKAPAAADIARFVGLRGFYGVGVILEDVTKTHAEAIKNHVDLVQAQGHVEELRKKAALVDEMAAARKQMEADHAAMLAEHERMKSELALLKAGGGDSSKRR
jgi:hypothetical protein